MSAEDKRAEEIADRILARFVAKEGFPKVGMARATLVVDENVNFLEAALKEANFRVLKPTKGLEDDEIKKTLLSHRILITKNTKDFLSDAPVYDYGIIGLEALPFVDTAQDYATNKTVKLISKAISDLDLVSERTGFVVVLVPDGKHRFKRLG